MAGRENINTTQNTAFYTRIIRSVNSARNGSSQLRTLWAHANVRGCRNDCEFSAENFGSAIVKRADVCKSGQSANLRRGTLPNPLAGEHGMFGLASDPAA